MLYGTFLPKALLDNKSKLLSITHHQIESTLFVNIRSPVFFRELGTQGLYCYMTYSASHVCRSNRLKAMRTSDQYLAGLAGS